MWQKLFGKNFARRRALRKVGDGPLRDYLSTEFSDKRLDCHEVEIVSLDLETTGLDPNRDAILTIGLIHICQMSIRLETAWHEVIQIDHAIPEESAVIHHITDDRAALGRPLVDVLPLLLRRLAGKVMLVHYSNIEQNFLDVACRKLYGAPFIIPTIDTLALAQRLYERRNHSIQPGDLRLFNLRPRYNLPRYKAHNALSDALATAELFLAMSAEMAPRKCTIGQFIT